MADKKKEKDRNRTIDPAALEVLANTEGNGVESAFDRYLNMQPQCQYGNTGICCTICIQGPCRITKKASKGICGAAPYTIVARNLIRSVLGGTSAHSDHGLHTSLVLKEVSDGHGGDYGIVDSDKLKRVAERLDFNTEGRSEQEVLKDVVDLALEEFGRINGQHSVWLQKSVVPERIEKFHECNIMPYSIHRTIAESMAQTHMGMDADPVNLVFQALKSSLCDFIGMHIATDLSDILFGTPTPVATEANMGVLEEKMVNIALHGHNPILSEMVVKAAREMTEEAKAVGAEGVKCMGICCTGNEVLMRQGVPVLTNFLSQELAIMTGAVDAMVVDIQCIMPGIQSVAECYHTKVVTTIPNAKIPSSYYVDFDETRAMEKAKEIVGIAIEAFKERNPDKINIPQVKNKVVAGFSLEAMTELFAAIDPDSPIKVVTDAVDSGELAGVCLFAGCNNLKVPHDNSHFVIATELAKNNVLMVSTGCAAGTFAKFGLMNYDAVMEHAGDGLKAFINRLNEANKDKLKDDLPLIFHMGSCVDNTRCYDFVTALAKQWEVDTPKVPFVASAPEAMSEKAVSIGSWCVTLGVPTHVGVMPPIPGSPLVDGIALQIAQDVYGGYFMWEEDPMEASKKLLAALQERTWKMNVHKMAAEKYETAVSETW